MMMTISMGYWGWTGGMRHATDVNGRKGGGKGGRSGHLDVII